MQACLLIEWRSGFYGLDYFARCNQTVAVFMATQQSCGQIPSLGAACMPEPAYDPLLCNNTQWW